MSFMRKTADSRCFDLADYFLADSPEAWRGMHRQELALAIQEAVEDYFASNEDLSSTQPQADEPS